MPVSEERDALQESSGDRDGRGGAARGQWIRGSGGMGVHRWASERGAHHRVHARCQTSHVRGDLDDSGRRTPARRHSQRRWREGRRADRDPDRPVRRGLPGRRRRVGTPRVLRSGRGHLGDRFAAGHGTDVPACPPPFRRVGRCGFRRRNAVARRQARGDEPERNASVVGSACGPTARRGAGGRRGRGLPGAQFGGCPAAGPSGRRFGRTYPGSA